MDGTLDRTLDAALASLRDDLDPPEGFAERMVDGLGLRWRVPARRLAHDPRARYAAASIGGVVLAAVVAALVLRRTARRAAA